MRTDQSLDDLVDALVDAVEARDAADPDGGSWQAAVRVRTLEEELRRRWRADRRPTEADPAALAAAGLH